jgi:hypothetical protein
MTVHSLHIFDRRGKTLFTKRYVKSPAGKGKNKNEQEQDEEALSEQRKLVFGMLFSLREMAGSLSPVIAASAADKAEEGSTGAVADLQLVKTGGSTLYNYETVSGLRFALFTTAETAYGVTSSAPINVTPTNAQTPSSTNNLTSGMAGVGGGMVPGGGGPTGATGGGAVMGGGSSGGGSGVLGGGGSSSGSGNAGASRGMTSPAVTANIRAALQHVYEMIWVNCVVRSPMYRGSETDISSTHFEATLDAYLKGMAWFR